MSHPTNCQCPNCTATVIKLTPGDVASGMKTRMKPKRKECPTCKSKGWFWDYRCNGAVMYQRTCPSCHGTGKVKA